MLSLSFLPRMSRYWSRYKLTLRDTTKPYWLEYKRFPPGTRMSHLLDRAETRYFGTPTGNLLGIITASLFLPAIFCSFVGDWLCTRFGRRITVMVGSVFIIAGGAWNGMSQSLAHFIACTYLLPRIDETDTQLE
jgi:MFS family permease